jgi:hypothetical protein
MLQALRGTARRARAAGIISPYSPGNANLPIGDAQPANREIGVPRIQPMRLLPRVNCEPSKALSKSTAIPSICSR